MKKIFWDLDGVLRDLCAGVSIQRGQPYNPYSWDEHVIKEVSLVQYLTLYPKLLIDSPPTEYCKLVPCGATILSCQQIDWIQYVPLWIQTNLNRVPSVKMVYCQHPEEKIEIINREDALLIEDFPKFSDNSRIIIVDRPYNWDVKDCYKRVKSAEELQAIING